MSRSLAAITLLMGALIVAAPAPADAGDGFILIYVLPEIYDDEIRIRYVLPASQTETWIKVPRSVSEISATIDGLYDLQPSFSEALPYLLTLSDPGGSQVTEYRYCELLDEPGGIELTDSPTGEARYLRLAPHDYVVEFTAEIPLGEVRHGKRRSIRIPIEASFPVDSVVVWIAEVERMREFSITTADGVVVHSEGGAIDWEVVVDPETTREVPISYTNPAPFPFDTESTRLALGLKLGVSNTRDQDVERLLGATIHPSLVAELFLGRQWGWNAVDLIVSFSASQGALIDPPNHLVNLADGRVSLWYRRHLPPIGFLSGLWVTGGAGYTWALAKVLHDDENHEPGPILIEGIIANADGPTYGIGAMWLGEARKFNSRIGERVFYGLEYRYTWSHLDTYGYHPGWWPEDTRLSVTGHTFALVVGFMVGTAQPASGL